MLERPPWRAAIAVLSLGMSLALTPWFTLSQAVVITNMIMLAWGLAMLLFILFHGQRWLVMLVGRLRGQMPVELVDSEGKVYNSLARTMEDGTMTASVYWFTNVGRCTLEPNGLVDRESQSCYIYFWLPLEKNQRVLHVMVNNLPDFGWLKGQSSMDRRRMMRDMIGEYQA